MKIFQVVALCVAVLLAGCATPYQKLTVLSLTGGFQEKDLGRNVVRISFGANGYTSRETAQCYWLYRCAEVTLEKGFDGFEILSDVRLTKMVSPYEAFGLQEPLFQRAQYYPIFIPMNESDKPFIEADIRLLKGEFEPAPPRIFNAHELKASLEPHVAEPIKSNRNVKPHVHDYLLPKGKLDTEA